MIYKSYQLVEQDKLSKTGHTWMVRSWEKLYENSKRHKSNKKTCVSSMIPSARPTVSPVVIPIHNWNLFCFAFWKVGRTYGWTYVQTPRAKIVITTGCDYGSASWINNRPYDISKSRYTVGITRWRDKKLIKIRWTGVLADPSAMIRWPFNSGISCISKGEF